MGEQYTQQQFTIPFSLQKGDSRAVHSGSSQRAYRRRPRQRVAIQRHHQTGYLLLQGYADTG